MCPQVLSCEDTEMWQYGFIKHSLHSTLFSQLPFTSCLFLEMCQKEEYPLVFHVLQYWLIASTLAPTCDSQLTKRAIMYWEIDSMGKLGVYSAQKKETFCPGTGPEFFPWIRRQNFFMPVYSYAAKKNCPTPIGKNYFACFGAESFFFWALYNHLIAPLDTQHDN